MCALPTVLNALTTLDWGSRRCTCSPAESVKPTPSVGGPLGVGWSGLVTSMTTLPARCFGSASWIACSVPDQAVASTAISPNLTASPGLATEPFPAVSLIQSLSLSSSGLRVPIFTSWPRAAKPLPSAWPTTPEPRMPIFIVLSPSVGSSLPEHLQRHLYPPERCTHLNPLHVPLHEGEHLAGDLHALGERRFLPLLRRLPHPHQHRLRHRHPRYLVRQVLRVAQAQQRPDPRHDRDAELLDALQEGLELRHVEHRLRDGKVRPGVHLPREA